MTRELTSSELEKLRSHGQATYVGLAIHSPTTILACEVNGAPSGGNDKVAAVNYDSVTAGSYGDVLVDMTCLVGSTAGACDVGICRVRKAPGASTLYLGETSEIEWANNQHLTVIDEFGLWGKHVRLVESGDSWITYMDYDITYTDQHDDLDPIPVLGANTVAKLTGETVDVDFDGSASFAAGSSISSYAWTCATANSITGAATATPTVTFDATGWHRVSCTVSANNGKSFTGHRYVYVYDDADETPLRAFELLDCSGDYERGGWSVRVRAYGDVSTSDVRNRALVILFADDYFDGTMESVGVDDDREHIIAQGWIVGESIEWDTVNGAVEFDVEGPQWWLKRIDGFPSGMDDVASASAWTEMDGLTVDLSLWHLLHWRTTVTRMMDIYLTGDDTPIGMFNAGRGSLWKQLLTASEAILARPACDHLGRLFVQVDTQFTPVTDRGSIPIVMAITSQDWRDKIQIERRIVPLVSQIDLSGVAWDHGALAGDALFSLSPGHVPKRYGDLETYDRLALSSQAQANELCGLLMGWHNNPYPAFGVRFAGNYRVFDVAPRQRATITVDATDTPRGITLSDYEILPRRVSIQLMKGDTGQALLVDVDFEGETDEDQSMDGDAPLEPPIPFVPWWDDDDDDDDYDGYDAAVIACSDGSVNQMLVSFDVYEACYPTWRNCIGNLENPLSGESDPDYGGDTGPGALMNVVMMGNVGYATCDSKWSGGTGPLPKNSPYTGLWYCSNVQAASPTWELAVSERDAYDETGVSAGNRFGALTITDNGVVCAMVHKHGGLSPANASLVAYIGDGVSLTPVSLGQYTAGGTTRYFESDYYFNGTIFCATTDQSSFYLSGFLMRGYTDRIPIVISGGIGGFSEVVHDTSLGNTQYYSIAPGYMTSHIGLTTTLHGPDWSTAVYDNINASRRRISVNGSGDVLYTGGDGLVLNGDVISNIGLYADCGGSGFGRNELGGYIGNGSACWLNDEDLLHVALTATEEGWASIILRSRIYNEARIWESITTNAYDVLEDDWVGHEDYLNSIVFPFKVASE